VDDRKPFQPIDGVTPRWQKLYNLVAERKIGDEVTYAEAIETLDLPRGRASRKVAQEAMREAQHHLEIKGERTVGTVANFGWVVLDAQRELGQVDRRRTKARRAAGRTLRGVKALNTRRDELSQFERQRLDFIGHSARVAQEATGRNGLTLEKFQKMIEGKPTD
jgi:hypothetical protein